VLTADHPNARWLNDFYCEGARISNDASLDAATRARRLQEHGQEIAKRLSPDFVIHTGGVRLATTGGMEFLARYAQRRDALTDVSGEVIDFAGALADDHYGIVYATFRTSRGDEVWERISMGAWRFEGGLVVEHWELPDGPRWDAFYLGADPELGGSALEFWTKPVA
jgi:hypothetical protein